MIVTVLGVAQPQGSLRSFRAKTGAIITKSDNPALKPWRQAVAAAAIERGVQIYDGAVGLDVTFYLPRPKGHYGARGLKPAAPALPIVKPDADKVLRAVLDALKGIAYRDDSQVTDPSCHKRYCDEGQPPSTLITIIPIHSEPEKPY
jgi:Holliday junction resolvase RusA-like endonuclease